MKYLILTVVIVFLFATPVKAMEYEAPQVPQSGSAYMPKETTSFSAGLWSIIKEGIKEVRPDIADAAGICISIIVCFTLCSIVNTFPGSSGKLVQLVSALIIGYLLLQPSNALIRLASNTISDLCQYGKMIFPVLTSALAANGGITKSTALYAGSVAFNTVLSAIISSFILPLIYIFLCISVASAAIGEEQLEKIKGFIKWLITWSLKIMLYTFTGYMGITGVVSGSTDAAALKATKLTISGVVPVVGGILSDASETVLVGAGVVKNVIGVYGLLAVVAVWIGPFVKIGIQYLLLKLSNAVCETISTKNNCKLLLDFTTAMGLLLAMTGVVSLFLMISIICFMKGVS